MIRKVEIEKCKEQFFEILRRRVLFEK